ncbi:EAL domain-containing protein [Pontibacterium sp.]|uniref:sensor domain-containing diguanylate cyclase n=1 Tax=Pontibacterium sp. TaxID=2036026 RepID=UPI003511699C
MAGSIDELSAEPGSAVAQPEVPMTVEELDQILKLQQELFASVARNDDHLSIIAQICALAEGFLPNAVASVMLLDPQTGLMNVLSAPSVPQQGIEALHGLKPGKSGGSCGNAVFSNQPVYVQDTFTDPRWADLRQIAYDFNLCSCWSTPVRNEKLEAIGSFALSSFEHRFPSAFHKRLLEVGAHIISIVLARQGQVEDLEASRKRIELMGTVLTQSSEGVLVTDEHNRIVETNAAFERITGYRNDEVRGRDPKLLSSGLQDTAFYERMWAELLLHDSWHGEITNMRKDGSALCQWMSLSVIRDPMGRIRNHVAVFTDLTELKAGKEKLVHALEHDQLTGLPNKSKLNMLLDEGTHNRSLLLLNVDNFSYINTGYSLAFGDKLLCAIARRLLEIEPEAQIFRINADEFALYFDREVDLVAANARVQKQFFSRQINVEDLGFNITFTAGGAVGHEGLASKAVQALRKARELGKNQFHLYAADSDEPDQAKRAEHIYWNGMLHDALANGGIEPYFQGIRDNRTGEIVKYEALVRLIEGGTVHSPYHFLEAARLSGLLPLITRRVIDRGFAQIAGTAIELSINVTEEDLNQHYLEQYLETKLAEYAVQPEQVTLEILEGVSSTGKKNHIKQLRALKARGYYLAIDDFGTEYSNFERILELNVDVVKIDAKYIKNIAEDNASYEITQAIVYFAKNAGIETVAEFVHSEAVQAIVEELGIEYSQGYLFSEPASEINL